MGLCLDEGQRERLRDLQSLVVLLVDLDASVMTATECLGDTLALNRIEASVLELESALDIVVELIKEIIERLGLGSIVGGL